MIENSIGGNSNFKVIFVVFFFFIVNIGNEGGSKVKLQVLSVKSQIKQVTG